MTNFPTSIDAPDDVAEGQYLDNMGGLGHIQVINNIYDMLEALEAKVGADGSAVNASHDYKLSGVTGSDKAVSKTGTETLTNKTLTTPVIPSIYQDAGKTKLMTLPDVASDTLVVVAGAQTLTNKTLTSPITQGLDDGWVLANESWAYASATTITVPTGAASRYSVGDKIKLTQTTVKYFYVVGVADTVLTVTGGTDYTVANAAISANYYSKSSSPVGFPHWFNYTPTGPTNVTLTGRFAIEGRKVSAIIMGTVTGAVNWTNMPTLPVTASTNLTVSGQFPIIGEILALNADSAYITGGYATLNSAKTKTDFYQSNTIAYSPTSPFTWANTDGFHAKMSYEI